MSTMRTTLTALVTTLALALPTAAVAVPLAGTDAPPHATLDRHDRALLQRVRVHLAHLQRLRAADPDGDGRPVDPADRPRPAADLPAPGLVTDVPVADTPPPTDVRPDEPRPTDRPTDRPTEPRPCDTDALRHQVFAVGEAGAVALAWNPCGVRIDGVRTAEGWRSEVVTHDRAGVRVAFWNTTTRLVFWARLTDDGLAHGIERVHDEPDTRSERFPVGDVGVVGLTWTRTAIVDVAVHAADGWRHEVARRSRTEVVVVFWNRTTKVRFHAALVDGEIRHEITREPVHDEAAPEPAPEPTRDAEATTAS